MTVSGASAVRGLREGGSPSPTIAKRPLGPSAGPAAGAGPGTDGPPRTIDLADDIPSSDDVDFEGSHLVGAQVVQQLLGGRVIEEREL